VESRRRISRDVCERTRRLGGRTGYAVLSTEYSVRERWCLLWGLMSWMALVVRSGPTSGTSRVYLGVEGEDMALFGDFKAVAPGSSSVSQTTLA
jgi:hypothetical protein